MRNTILFILACACSALVPLLSGPAGAAKELGNHARKDAPGSDIVWPTHWEGRPLRPMPLTSQEVKFAGAFPGAIARFTDGSTEILFRRVDRPTRKLHPSSDCLRASGYSVTPLPAETSAHGRTWSCLLAKRKDQSLRVKEMVVAGNGEPGPGESTSGESWTDVSSWYWNAFWGNAKGPWTAITLSRRL